MKLVCISDTHTHHRELGRLPECDVIVFAGDATWTGELDKLNDFASWLADQPATNKIAIAGNHDWCFADDRAKRACHALQSRGIDYLQDGSLTVDDVKFYGSPWQPEFCNWAFNLQRGHELRNKWKLIPDDVNVLITHGPPNGILDMTPRGERAGCHDLRRRVEDLKQLKLHIFGHIHEGYGTQCACPVGRYPIFINASNCTGYYQCTNELIEVEI